MDVLALPAFGVVGHDGQRAVCGLELLDQVVERLRGVAPVELVPHVPRCAKLADVPRNLRFAALGTVHPTRFP